jgi:hypothetical protein
MGTAGFDRAYGYGRIDVLNSLSLVQPPVCGDGDCTGDEDPCSCAQDCGSPPTAETGLCTDGVDNDCDTYTDCDDSDCSADLACICNNNGICELGEDCNNCPIDCRQKTTGNPNSRYCCDGDQTDCGDPRCSESGWSCGDSGVCTSDPDCDDGLYCNGPETCFDGSCQEGIDPCPGQGCDEGSDQCVTCGGNKAPCSDNIECCSNKCKNGSCRGN